MNNNENIYSMIHYNLFKGLHTPFFLHIFNRIHYNYSTLLVAIVQNFTFDLYGIRGNYLCVLECV